MPAAQQPDAQLKIARTLLAALAASASSAAAEGFDCDFASEACEAGKGIGCGAGETFSARIRLFEGEWRLAAEGASFALEKIEAPSAEAAHFLIRTADLAASDMSLLSVFDDGTAFLSMHGDFLGPWAHTMTGACREAG
jgi:hypothetical protein